MRGIPAAVSTRVRRYLEQRLNTPQIEIALRQLADRGFKPELIFDVGAYKGEFTQLCLQHWPTASVACFEPLPQRVEELKALARRNASVRVFPGLLGARCEQAVTFHELETSSSVLEEWAHPEFPASQHPMITIDRVVTDSFGGRSPDFLKMDTQGYELEILKGAEKSLAGMKAILAELNLLDLHKGAGLLGDVVCWLNERGWVAYDICGLHRRPLDNALWCVDLLFVPQDTPLRADKRWG